MPTHLFPDFPLEALQVTGPTSVGMDNHLGIGIETVYYSRTMAL